VIYSGPTADRKLNELGLDYATIREALLYGAAEKATYTEYDAPGTGEHARWSRHVRSLTQSYVPQGWKRINPDCQPTLVHPSRKWCLVVTSGDRGTGNANARPTTNNPKGRSIRNAVAENAEFALFTVQEIEPDLEGLRQTWLLMYYVNLDGEVQAEVSLPREMSGNYISDYVDRILLPNTNPSDGLPYGLGNEEPPDYDFAIVRK
jgi:hypothetical protein